MSFLIKRGKYYYYYRYVGENDNRKRISISLKVTTQSSAKILQQELDLKYARRDLGLRVVEPIAITRMIREYLVWLDTVKRKSYYRRINVIFDNFSKFLEDRDEVLISDISYAMIHDYVTYCKNDIAPKTLNEEIRNIRLLMEHAVKSDHLESFDIDWSEFRLDEEKDLRHFPHFTPEDLQKIWASDLPYKDYYKVCYYTGMRSGDVANLKRDDIDRKRHLIQRITEKKKVPVSIPIHPEIRCIERVKDEYFSEFTR